MATKGLVERLKDGEDVLIAEGYLWECERRGYITLGANIPEVVIENPGLLKGLHEEFVHAGTDVVEAFNYYAHRSKLRMIGREDDLERLNRMALKMAREVADASGKLMAGGLCGTLEYKADDPKSIEWVRSMFKELIEWVVEEKADFIIAETFYTFGEAMLALETIKEFGHGLPAVITLAPHASNETFDKVPLVEACVKLEQAGAAVVGLNCGRGPTTMLPLIKEIRAACKGPIAALPVCYRTNEDSKSFQSLRDPMTGELLKYIDLACVHCSRTDIRKFGEAAKAIGVNYVGLCCGNAANYFRELAESYGRKPEACKYSPNLTGSTVFSEGADADWYRYFVG